MSRGGLLFIEWFPGDESPAFPPVRECDPTGFDLDEQPATFVRGCSRDAAQRFQQATVAGASVLQKPLQETFPRTVQSFFKTFLTPLLELSRTIVRRYECSDDSENAAHQTTDDSGSELARDSHDLSPYR